MINLHTVKNLKLLKQISLQKSDVLRIEMRDCLSQIDHFNKQAQALLNERFHEENFSAQAEHMGTTHSLDAYRDKQKRARADIIKSKSEAENAYDVLSEQLGILFSEQKSYEITIEDWKKKELAREKREEMLFFDEVAMQKWRSKR
ncbi:MAG: hypothetical protein V4482_02930 [Pseudomonadota bacterium]